MKTKCEMDVSEYFNLSVGHMVFVGKIILNIGSLISGII